MDTRVVLGGLENDVRAFIQHERDGNKKLVTDNPEVDGLVRLFHRFVSSHFTNAGTLRC